MTNHRETNHLTDEQLAAVVLGEGAARGHLPCDRCTPRVQQLREQWEQVSSAIDEVDLPPGFRYPVMPAGRQPRSQPRGWLPPTGTWRLAAGICLLVVAGAVSATTDLGAWLAGLRDRGSLGGEAVVPGAAAPADRPVPRGARISFPVEGPEMAVDLLHPQRTGRVVLYPAAESSALIEVADATGTEIPLIREGGVQIRNSPASSTDYRVGVPSGVERVRIRIGRGPPRLVTRAQVVEGREIGVDAARRGPATP